MSIQLHTLLRVEKSGAHAYIFQGCLHPWDGLVATDDEDRYYGSTAFQTMLPLLDHVPFGHVRKAYCDATVYGVGVGVDQVCSC